MYRNTDILRPRTYAELATPYPDAARDVIASRAFYKIAIAVFIYCLDNPTYGPHLSMMRMSTELKVY